MGFAIRRAALSSPQTNSISSRAATLPQRHLLAYGSSDTRHGFDAASDHRYVLTRAVQVTTGGAAPPVQFAGASPQLVFALVQNNATVRAGVSPGPQFRFW
jgi:uncharacterized protein (TIGR03437 family)